MEDTADAIQLDGNLFTKSELWLHVTHTDRHGLKMPGIDWTVPGPWLEREIRMRGGGDPMMFAVEALQGRRCLASFEATTSPRVQGSLSCRPPQLSGKVGLESHESSISCLSVIHKRGAAELPRRQWLQTVEISSGWCSGGIRRSLALQRPRHTAVM